ncbi:MAG: endolytic transglycosylase MltG [Chloroflexi bacterium]|nr:MAG: endolytic transglycosylase MltG [Chloroflexota bacterium]
MNRLVSLLRILIIGPLLLVGVLAVVVLMTRLFIVTPTPRPDERLRVDLGPGYVPPPVDPSLQAALLPRLDEINAPASDDPTLFYFRIDQGETVQTVAQRLQKYGFITDAGLFQLLLQYNGLDTAIQAGDYYIRRNMSMRQIAAALYRGRAALHTVAVPPGWRLEQVGQYLDNRGVMDGELFIQQARQGTVVSHPILADRPPGMSYEGYLFPGEYLLPDNPQPADLIYAMLTRMAGQLPDNAVELAHRQGLTFYQALTVASIVEREAALPQERPLIASVYLNRLKPESGTPYLQADPTVQYAAGYQPDTGQWWKAPMRLEEYKTIDSPYNTYLYPGLPPGPIASPGLDSILAVLNPADTDYLFFVCKNPNCAGGEHVFSATYEEHLENVERYWNAVSGGD